MWNNSNPPSLKHFFDPCSGKEHRHHLDPSAMQRAFKGAVHKSGIHKRVTAHTFRHSFAIHLLQNSGDVHTLQRLLEHEGVRATMIYNPAPESGARLYAAL